MDTTALVFKDEFHFCSVFTGYIYPTTTRHLERTGIHHCLTTDVMVSKPVCVRTSSNLNKFFTQGELLR